MARGSVQHKEDHVLHHLSRLARVSLRARMVASSPSNPTGTVEYINIQRLDVSRSRAMSDSRCTVNTASNVPEPPESRSAKD